MNQEQEQCKVCGRAKSYVMFRPNPIMVCKLGHRDDEPLEPSQPKQKPIRTTGIQQEITEKLLHDMKDGTLKCQVLKRVNDCEYDMHLMRTLTDVVIEMAEQMEDTYIKKYMCDSGKIYQSWEPVTFPYRTTGVSEMLQPTSYSLSCVDGKHPGVNNTTGKCIACGMVL